MNLARSLQKSPSKTRTQWYGLSLGVAGAIGMWGAGDWHWSISSALAAAALVAAGAVTDRSRVRRRTIGDDELDTFVASTEQFGRDVLPVWSAHIESSRAQMEVAVAALTQRFASIVDRLDQALKSSVHGTDQGLANVFEESTRELRGVLDSLSEAMASNRAMTQEVQSLSRFIDELQSMAAEVANIAAQTNLLAINAAIEAAHAGEGGRSFGVLAQEVRKLSAMSGETGTRMAQKVETISAAIEAARQAADASARREESSAVASEAAITGVLETFRKVTHELETSASVLKQESIGIQAEIVDALIQLQFQDRVSQRMTHVRHNIERLPELLADSRQQFVASGDLVPVDTAALLAELHSSYAMDDERATHGTGAAAKPATRMSAVEEVTFF
jgi:methyl-accepting chemotaxis protein